MRGSSSTSRIRTTPIFAQIAPGNLSANFQVVVIRIERQWPDEARAPRIRRDTRIVTTPAVAQESASGALTLQTRSTVRWRPIRRSPPRGCAARSTRPVSPSRESGPNPEVTVEFEKETPKQAYGVARAARARRQARQAHRGRRGDGPRRRGGTGGHHRAGAQRRAPRLLRRARRRRAAERCCASCATSSRRARDAAAGPLRRRRARRASKCCRRSSRWQPQKTRPPPPKAVGGGRARRLNALLGLPLDTPQTLYDAARRRRSDRRRAPP